MTTATMQTILHITVDFPDALVPAKTRAVEALIAGVGDFRHVIYSLNRASWHRGVAALPFGRDRIALAYGAPPYGIGLAYHLRPVAETILNDLTQREVFPSLIHAHKLSVDGLIASELAERLGCRYIASLWGDTDIKIFEAKPGLRERYREIAGQATLLLPAAPWTASYFRDALALDPARLEILPVMTAADALLQPVAIGAPRFVTVLRLDCWHRKGLDTLAQAIALLAQEIPSVTLDVYGGGSPKALLEVTNMIHKSGAASHINLLGPLPHSAVQKTMNGYAALVMPTRRETYGMVHVEALFSGLPILWSRDRGIDGLVDGTNIGYRCDPTSVDDVVKGLRVLATQEETLKREVLAAQMRGAFECLRRPAIAERYRSLLKQAIDSGSLIPRRRPRPVEGSLGSEYRSS
jgi:glycosyltransferase involved in cell wall biosynthesis